MNADDFYTIDGAATWLQAHGKSNMTQRNIAICVSQGTLNIYFEYVGDLTFVSIQKPDGGIEKIEIDVPIDGIVKCISPPNRDKGESDVMDVEIYELYSSKIIYRDGKIFKGHHLPTTISKEFVRKGHVKPGYKVAGMTPYIEVPVEKWLFNITDLEDLAGSDKPKHNQAPPFPSTYEKSSPETTIASIKTGDNEPVADKDTTLALLFDPVPVAALEKMFPADGKWKSWAERAASNGLKDAAKDGRAKFNPYKAAIWFADKGMVGWDLAKCYRVLKNNLPARSLDNADLLTGGIG